MGAPVFDAIIAEKVYPVFGDLTQPNLGLQEDDHRMILKYVNIIFNCAANVDGNERLDTSVKVE
jgi:thioester reductase-like protein